ncbi:UNVERIFIED_CONTAM: hypothetical protein HHA_262550 [Hammondia hammondi]|eukprot:XP_008882862.1 hypothetical protein HHA_262550 [Hammondia hammondi]
MIAETSAATAVSSGHSRHSGDTLTLEKQRAKQEKQPQECGSGLSPEAPTEKPGDETPFSRDSPCSALSPPLSDAMPPEEQREWFPQPNVRGEQRPADPESSRGSTERLEAGGRQVADSSERARAPHPRQSVWVFPARPDWSYRFPEDVPELLQVVCSRIHGRREAVAHAGAGGARERRPSRTPSGQETLPGDCLLAVVERMVAEWSERRRSKTSAGEQDVAQCLNVNVRAPPEMPVSLEAKLPLHKSNSQRLRSPTYPFPEEQDDQKSREAKKEEDAEERASLCALLAACRACPLSWTSEKDAELSGGPAPSRVPVHPRQSPEKRGVWLFDALLDEVLTRSDGGDLTAPEPRKRASLTFSSRGRAPASTREVDAHAERGLLGGGHTLSSRHSPLGSPSSPSEQGTRSAVSQQPSWPSSLSLSDSSPLPSSPPGTGSSGETARGAAKANAGALPRAPCPPNAAVCTSRGGAEIPRFPARVASSQCGETPKPVPPRQTKTASSQRRHLQTLPGSTGKEKANGSGKEKANESGKEKANERGEEQPARGKDGRADNVAAPSRRTGLRPQGGAGTGRETGGATAVGGPSSGSSSWPEEATKQAVRRALGGTVHEFVRLPDGFSVFFSNGDYGAGRFNGCLHLSLPSASSSSPCVPGGYLLLEHARSWQMPALLPLFFLRATPRSCRELVEALASPFWAPRHPARHLVFRHRAHTLRLLQNNTPRKKKPFHTGKGGAPGRSEKKGNTGRLGAAAGGGLANKKSEGGKREEWGKNRDCLAKNRDCLAKNRDCLAKNRDCLAKNRDCLAKNRDCLAKNRDCFAKETREKASNADADLRSFAEGPGARSERGTSGESVEEKTIGVDAVKKASASGGRRRGDPEGRLRDGEGIQNDFENQGHFKVAGQRDSERAFNQLREERTCDCETRGWYSGVPTETAFATGSQKGSLVNADAFRASSVSGSPAKASPPPSETTLLGSPWLSTPKKSFFSFFPSEPRELDGVPHSLPSDSGSLSPFLHAPLPPVYKHRADGFVKNTQSVCGGEFNETSAVAFLRKTGIEDFATKPQLSTGVSVPPPAQFYTERQFSSFASDALTAAAVPPFPTDAAFAASCDAGSSVSASGLLNEGPPPCLSPPSLSSAAPFFPPEVNTRGEGGASLHARLEKAFCDQEFFPPSGASTSSSTPDVGVLDREFAADLSQLSLHARPQGTSAADAGHSERPSPEASGLGRQNASGLQGVSGREGLCWCRAGVFSFFGESPALLGTRAQVGAEGQEQKNGVVPTKDSSFAFLQGFKGVHASVDEAHERHQRLASIFPPLGRPVGSPETSQPGGEGDEAPLFQLLPDSSERSNALEAAQKVAGRQTNFPASTHQPHAVDRDFL